MCTPASPVSGIYGNFAEIDVSNFFPGKTLRAGVVQAINDNILEGTMSPEIFGPVVKSHGQTVALPTSTIDGYAYKREELHYIWYYESTGPETSGIRLPLFGASINQATGVVTLNTWRLLDGAKPSYSNDGTIVVVVIAERQRQQPEIEAAQAVIPDDAKPADEIKGSLNYSTLSAAQSGVAMRTIPSSRGGLYRVTYRAKVTRAASSSSTLGGANGFQVHYTDDTDNVAAVSPPTVGNSGNTTAAVVGGSVIINIKGGTAVTFDFGYTSSGATSMQYELTVAWDEVIPTGGPTIGGVTYKWLGNYSTNF